MDEIVRIKDQYYILASSSLADDNWQVLKQSETFAIFDQRGDIRPFGFENHGIYHQGTRYLSRHTLKFEGKNPLFLSSIVEEDNDLLVVDLTNPDFSSQSSKLIHRGTIHLIRTYFLWEGCCYERIVISNFGLEPTDFSFSLEFGADYADIFEVRGIKRKKRGRMLDPVAEGNHLTLGYIGLDGKVRKTRIDITPEPQKLSANNVNFYVKLDSRQETTFSLTFACELEDETVRVETYDSTLNKVRSVYQSRHKDCCMVETSNEQFNDWLNRSNADLCMMLTKTPYGLYPYAGIPWFSTIFGRDGIIAALETLWLLPEISRGVLNYLAAHQAKAVIPEQDAEPGKILHEERKGEMATLKEIPFGCYYGTVDATPLFIILAGYYYERTADLDFIRQLWPHVEHALDWIDTYGDCDKDGFVEYKGHSNGGLRHQGWKDSEDPVFHADGSLASSPIALCEVQGYVYEAKLKAAQLAFILGRNKDGEKLLLEAESLRKKFLKVFWCKEQETYALALDGKKLPCRVKSSNAGHCLFTGIASEKHARIIVQNLTSKSFFTGWGIRTVASSEIRYNPMSYHNGSVWPHDNALIGFGMSRYGFKDAALKVLTGLFDASIFANLHRLPELFCGFERRRGEGPTLYPVACNPQAWASGAIYLLLQACIGLSIKAHEKKIYFNHPALPQFLEEVTIKNLTVGAASLDIQLQRHAQDVGINVTRRKGDIKVVVTK